MKSIMQSSATHPWLVVIGVALLSLVWACPSKADLFYESGPPSSTDRSASVDFSLSGTTLTVTLTNTSTVTTTPDATWVLGAVGFNSTSSALTPVSATVPSGSTLLGSVVNNVGEGWQYESGISFHSYNSGISETGLGVFGPDGNFYSPGVKLDGSDYGVVGSAGTNGSNPSVKEPLVESTIVFTLTTPSGFTLADLGSTVVFQYGTDLSEPTLTGDLVPVPEPSTMAIAGLGALGFMGYGLRRRLKK